MEQDVSEGQARSNTQTAQGGERSGQAAGWKNDSR